jgi:hypothetical protein
MTEFYKKYADKKIRLKAAFFILMSFALLGIVIIDSFRIKLPFHYILFFIFGLLVSVVVNHFSKVSWDDVNSKITADMNYFVLLFLGAWALSEYLLFPAILQKINITYIKAALLLTSSGLYYGRIIFMWKSIRAQLFTDERINKYFESKYKNK